MTITFRLNSRPVTLTVAADRRVVDILREDLGVTGTKEGCGTGECGACTILIDGEARLSCLMIAAQIDGADITTVEGLEHTEEGSILKEAFVEQGAVQCGYCTPGMELAAFPLLNETQTQEVDRERIKVALSGNLCRCTGYVKIVDAVARAGAVLAEKRKKV